MIYSALRWVAGIALHWFYRDIRIVRADRIPQSGPLLIAVNHQNALVDSLIVGWLMPRRVTMTAKATLSENPFISQLFRMIHVVPLRRRSDELQNGSLLPFSRSSNAEAFREILDVLHQGSAVLIFPEGKSHNETGLEPLKTGLARLALQARDEIKLSGLRILPVCLVFEEKGVPGTVAAAYIAEPIEMDSWPNDDRLSLTAEIADRIRAVSELGLPPERSGTAERRRNTIRETIISCAAWWGRTTHQLPIRLARSIAVRQSTSADQPAMLTIIFGIGLVLLTYAVHLTIVGVVTHSVWIDGFYLAGLLSGAYWAAFQRHPRRDQS
jgi:1-acyl-sn-glycerol-3-phosphate acyltransferase